MPAESPENSLDPQNLCPRLVNLSLDALKQLAFDLDIDWEALAGEQKPAKVRALINYCRTNTCYDELVQIASRLLQPIPEPGEPPFKGLDFFGVDDEDMFYGREQLTTELLAHLKDHNFLAVVGASGSGKSSVVRAGIVANLKRL